MIYIHSDIMLHQNQCQLNMYTTCIVDEFRHDVNINVHKNEWQELQFIIFAGFPMCIATDC